MKEAFTIFISIAILIVLAFIIGAIIEETEKDVSSIPIETTTSTERKTKSDNSNSKYSEDKTKLIIKMYVEDIIKEKLKSPSTAKFPSLSDWSIYEKSYNTYSVSSYVDAENGFGAEIRTYFSLTVTTDNEILDYSDLYYSE